MHPPYHSATELASSIRSGSLSPVTVVDALVERIDSHDDEINAFVHVLETEAREAAREAERAVESGEELGPLHGVPVAIKDLDTPVEGVPMTCGSKPLEGLVSETDALIVERLREAGAIVLGTTNVPEFGHKGTTDNPLHGATGTPFDPDRIAGGSTGGGAAAVAAGMAPLAQGTDAGGSIRIPASCCGVVGLLPTYGLVPFDSRPDALESHTPFTCHGPIARTVEDAALMLEVVSGWHSADPFSVPKPDADYVAATRRGIDGARIAYSPDLGVYPVDDRVEEVVDDAVDAFERGGATVERRDPDVDRSHGELLGAWETGFMLLMASLPDKVEAETGIDLMGDHREALTPEFVEYIERGRDLGLVDLKRADVIRTEFFDAVRAVLDDHDLLVTPTLAVPPFETDVLGPTEVDGTEVDPLFGWPLTWPFNLTGQPVASIPAGFTDDGLPVGLQIVGERFDDEAVLAAAGTFERLEPWREAYPYRE